MRVTIIPLTVASLLLAALLSPSLAQPAQPAPSQPTPAQPTPAQPTPAQPRSKLTPSCAQIAAACKQAGFIRNGAKTGAGIVVDCIRPIMVGTPQGTQGTKPLPQIDPQVVASCKQQNPNFGMGGRARSQPSEQPPPKGT